MSGFLSQLLAEGLRGVLWGSQARKPLAAWGRMPATGSALAGAGRPHHPLALPSLLCPGTPGPWALGAKGSYVSTWLPRAQVATGVPRSSGAKDGAM